jgi:hypothetical protein
MIVGTLRLLASTIAHILKRSLLFVVALVLAGCDSTGRPPGRASLQASTTQQTAGSVAVCSIYERPAGLTLTLTERLISAVPNYDGNGDCQPFAGGFSAVLQQTWSSTGPRRTAVACSLRLPAPDQDRVVVRAGSAREASRVCRELRAVGWISA